MLAFTSCRDGTRTPLHARQALYQPRHIPSLWDGSLKKINKQIKNLKSKLFHSYFHLDLNGETQLSCLKVKVAFVLVN